MEETKRSDMRLQDAMLESKMWNEERSGNALKFGQLRLSLSFSQTKITLFCNKKSLITANANELDTWDDFEVMNVIAADKNQLSVYLKEEAK